MITEEQMLHMPHHRSRKRLPMAPESRAAQFAPFAALTGYDEVIAERGRLTDRQGEADEGIIDAVDEALRLLRERIPEAPVAKVRYFIPDRKKEGGAWAEKTGAVKKVDPLNQLLLFADGTAIPFRFLWEILL